ncbi:conserved Plasmodium protein, unknown function [Plasmodium ovale]|uniref:G-patch domain-containing protein n=1 Tax=Plasmodium ovale TaxID=36330 RepID=A0A1D3U8C6_PLAOA|nr:conserved Plasmodium protein, unknown function [Plasmodium ovale]
MDTFSDDLSYTHTKNEKKKKKKKSYSKHTNTKNGRKDNISKDVDEEKYLKPVKFVSAGFLNYEKTKSTEQKEEEHKRERQNDLIYSTDSDSDNLEEYDVFKNFVFNFNFHMKSEENDFIKNNLKKYNLTELREADKNFEKYGLGFKILRKMGYEDGIGNKIKTNIAPIEVKEHTRVLKEKKQKYSDDYVFNINKSSNETYNIPLNEHVHISTLWKKKFNLKKYWNFNYVKNQINAKLKSNTYYTQNEIFNSTNYYLDNIYVCNMQQMKNALNEHTQNISHDYFSSKKKQKEAENKFMKCINYVNKNDIYKTHLLILKNALTYKYILNLHTILPYPFLFNNASYNEYIFERNCTGLKVQDKECDHRSSPNPYIPTLFDLGTGQKSEKLINLRVHVSSPLLVHKEENHNGDCTSSRNVLKNATKTELYHTSVGAFEEKLNDTLTSNYQTLRRRGYFEDLPKQEGDNPQFRTSYRIIDNLQDIYNLIDVKNIQVKERTDPVFLRDIYTFLFFIYDNSEFLLLNSYVSKFFLEFLRIFFSSKKRSDLDVRQRYDYIHDEKSTQQMETQNKKFSPYADLDFTKEKVVYADSSRISKYVPVEEHETTEEWEKCSHNPSKDNGKNKLNEKDVTYLIHIKKLILMGCDKNNITQYQKIENEFDDIIYFNLLYSEFYQQNYISLFNYIKLFKHIFSRNYYESVLIFFINKVVMTNTSKNENDPIDDSTLTNIENKLSILLDINKQFDINSYINNYYTYFLFIYMQKSEICENYIQLIKIALTNNIYKKEIFEVIVKRLIYELTIIDFADINFEHLNKIMILHKCLDENIIVFIYKVYFFYNYSKHVCNYLRELNWLLNNHMETACSMDKEITQLPEQDPSTTDGQKKEILRIKKKEIYETFKKVKDVFENNLMKNDSIKNIMFSILNVIKTYIVQEKIITFSVEKVLDYDKKKIHSEDKINYYFSYKDIKIPVPLYAVPKSNNKLYEINPLYNMQKNKSVDDSGSDYKFSKKKYLNIMNKLENEINEYENIQQHDENINVKNYIEKYCLQNGILFLQKNDRKVNGNVIFSVNNISIYINNNIIYVFEDLQWKPILLSELLDRI